MHSKNSLNLEKGSLNVGLYSIVFLSRASVYVVLFLFLSFLIQPVHQAFADEVEEEEQTEQTETLEITTPAEVDFDDGQGVNESEEVVVENSTETEEAEENTEEITDTEIVEEETVVIIELDESGTVSTSTDFEDGADNATSTDEIPGEDADVTPEVPVDGVATSTNETGSTSTSTEETSEYTASTTPGFTDEDAEAATSTDILDEGSASTSTEDSVEDETSTSSSQVSEDSGSSSTDNEESSVEEKNEVDTDVISSDNEEVETVGFETDNEPENTSDSPDSDEEENVGDDIIEEGISDIVSEVVTLTRQLVTEENYYQFSRQSCVPVGDGTFHCTQNTGIAIDEDSVVYAEQDEEGDMEIFLKTSKGKVEQITDNEFDDTAPDYDAETMTLVWQRLIDGRYQIVSYNIKDSVETQLTFSRTNNMEPKVSKEGIVWQAWDGNDWEIVLFDGKFTDIITDNEIQDVTPVIEDGYILWSILGGKEQEARVYSIDSGEIMTITGHEGGAVANPRFVLVYDTKFDNGDVVTQGFDPVTGLSAPISAQPAEDPVEIPESDPIGEVRALIQNKSTHKDNGVVTVSLDDDAGSLDISNASTSASNLVLSDLTDHGLDMNQATVTDMIAPEFELTEYDLVITPETTSTSFDDIADELPVITERVASSTQE